MSLVSLAAELIRRAVVDEGWRQTLDAAVRQGQDTSALLYGEIVDQELGWFTASEWLWFGRWRQSNGGPLDLTLVRHLERRMHSRFARFEIRMLAMTDPGSNEGIGSGVMHPGIQWLHEHVVRTVVLGPLAVGELVRDALQASTAAAAYTVSILRSEPSASPTVDATFERLIGRHHERNEAVDLWLVQSAEN